jgi:ATP-binding cassette, subfamily B (MDR/TAP), member 1
LLFRFLFLCREGIQFFTTGVGGLGYALYASWQVALVVLALCPFISISALAVVSLNQSKSSRAAVAYSKAGSIAYSTVSGIKTVLSLNAASTMIQHYREATQQALSIATAVLLKQGFANGSMLGSFICLYAVLALYGTFMLYREIDDNGCDPSGAVIDNVTCESTGADVFGAMLGVAFAAQGISQVGNFLETFAAGRAAVHSALRAINRKPGEPEEVIYHDPLDDKDGNTMSRTSRSLVSDDADLETPEGRIRAILPKYEIDATSDAGKKPKNIIGEMRFEDVKFHYPTRPGHAILKGLSVDIPAGKTVAFVGPSGGGKSTIVKLLERFYDPVEGSVLLDGLDIKDINVRHLRSLIGYVGQEPTLFATSIANNIRYGKPGCTQKEIENAAIQANAHDFISQLPDGYDTQVRYFYCASSEFTFARNLTNGDVPILRFRSVTRDHSFQVDKNSALQLQGC